MITISTLAAHSEKDYLAIENSTHTIRFHLDNDGRAVLNKEDLDAFFSSEEANFSRIEQQEAISYFEQVAEGNI